MFKIINYRAIEVVFQYKNVGNTETNAKKAKYFCCAAQKCANLTVSKPDLSGKCAVGQHCNH